MKNLIIIGAGGHGKVVADVAMSMNRWKAIQFADDNKAFTKVMGLDVICTTKEIVRYLQGNDVFVAIGNNSTRRKLIEDLESEKASIVSLIHKNSIIGSDVEIGTGTVVMAGAIINCSTRIGKGCIINTSATVDHDSKIGDFVHISPGAHMGGLVVIGDEAWIGIGSIVRNNITIGPNCILGAGAVAVNDIDRPGIYIGLPAKHQNKEWRK